jgi:septum formation protein
VNVPGSDAPAPRPVHPPLVLASTSPRRAALLGMLGLPHEVLPVSVPEDFGDSESPDSHVERLAREKAAAGAAARPDALVIGGDTVVVLDRKVLGKPPSAEQALKMLLQLSGRTHVVHSGLALQEPGGAVHAIALRTRVTFRSYDEATAQAYVATGEPLDKAGAYGIQGMGAALVSAIDGDYYTVVGMPVAGLVELLARAGWRYAFGGLVRAAGAPEPKPPPTEPS